jgi:hypothetical protein
MKGKTGKWFGRGLLAIVVLAVTAVSVGCGGGGTSVTPSATNTPSGPNQSPVIDKVIPEWTQIERGKSGQIKCIAHDPDGDTLIYEWVVDRGELSGSGDTVGYTAPLSYVHVLVNVTVRDGRGGSMIGAASFEVVCCGYAQKNPEWPVEPVE